MDKLTLCSPVDLQPRIYPILRPDTADRRVPSDDCNVLESIAKEDVGVNEACDSCSDDDCGFTLRVRHARLGGRWN